MGKLVDALIEDDFPYPIALTFKRLRDAIAVHRTDEHAFRQLVGMRDCIETLVRYLALVALSARLEHQPQRNSKSDDLNAEILKVMAAPALGSWTLILERLSKDAVTKADLRLAPLFEFIRRFHGSLTSFNREVRKDVIAHGILRNAAEDRADVNTWLPRLREMLSGAGFLADWELVEADSRFRSWMGAQALATRRVPRTEPVRIRAAATHDGELLLFVGAGAPISLHPFLDVLECTACGQKARLFLYDSQATYTRQKKRIYMIEATGGHKKQFEQSAVDLLRRFSETDLLAGHDSNRRIASAKQANLIDFDFQSYRERIGQFVGRKPLLAAIDAFANGRSVSLPGWTSDGVDRGYFVLVADPGLGKTSLLTQWIAKNTICPEPVFFFWRAGRGLTRFDFVRHVYHALCRRHRLRDGDAPIAEHDYPARLDELLRRISERHVAKNSREVIVIDGLDEAGNDVLRAESIEAIPPKLPPRIYFLIASRPTNEIDSFCDERKAHCRRYVLKAGSDWNREDVREFVNRRLGHSIRPPLLAEIEATAAGNFLWADHFCNAVRAGTLRTEALELALPRFQTLDGLYGEFWNRIIEQSSEVDRTALRTLAGVLAVARAPLTAEQLGRFFGLEEAEFLALRRQVQPILDVVSIDAEGDAETPMFGFRLYHPSFRDFVLRQPGAALRDCHRRIAAAYLQVDEGKNVAEWDRYGLMFAVQHAVEAGMWEPIEDLLTNLEYLETKAEAGLAYELCADYAQVSDAMPTDRPARRTIGLLENALRRSVDFINRHPSAVFQSMWNSCWWFDCKFAVDHYAPLSGGWPAEGPPWNRPGRELSTLMESWGAAKAARTPGFLWLRSLRPPALPLGGSQQRVLTGNALEVWSVAISPDGRRIASGSRDKTVRVWDVDRGSELMCLTGHHDRVDCVAFSPNGGRIASGSFDRTVRIWDANEGHSILFLARHTDAVKCVAFSPDGQRAASGSADKTVMVYDLTSGAVTACLTGHTGPVSGVAFSPDGRLIATCGDDATVRVWDAQRFRLIGTLYGHLDCVYAVAFSQDGRHIASGSADKTARIWDVASRRELTCLAEHGLWVSSVAFSPDGRRLATASGDKTIGIWDWESRRLIACLVGHEMWVSSVAYFGDGSRIASGSHDKTIRVWDTRSWSPIPQLVGHQGVTIPGRSCVAFTHDGCRIVTSSVDNTARVWDSATGLQLNILEGHTDWVDGIAVSPDGGSIATASWDNTVRLWNTTSARQLACLEGHQSKVTCVAFSPNGRTIASGSIDDTLLIWDATNFCEIARHTGQIGAIEAIAFAPSGTQIALASCDKTVHLWDARSGRELLRLSGHQSWVSDVGFSPDSARIVSRSRDGAVRVWDVQSGKLLEETASVLDVGAIAGGEDRYPWRLFQRNSETVLESAATGTPVAWYSAELLDAATHPQGRTWAAWSTGELHFFTLTEGAVALPANADDISSVAAPTRPVPGRDASDLAARIERAVAFFRGHDFSLSHAEAVKWIRLGAERGLADAQFELGLALIRGKEVPQDFNEAADWLTLAAEQGHSLAQSELAVMYVEGRGRPRDQAIAESWWLAAASQGVVQSMFNLGRLNVQRKQFAEARTWLESAANLGDAAAQYLLAMLLELGRAGAPDPHAARLWYGKAARQGHVEAQVGLGRLFRDVLHDPVEAERWLTIAANQGNAPSQNALGVLLVSQGRKEEARFWFQAAAAQGFDAARQNLLLL